MLEFGLIFKQSNSQVGTEGLKSDDLHTEPHMSKTDESPQDGVCTSGRKGIFLRTREGEKGEWRRRNYTRRPMSQPAHTK